MMFCLGMIVGASLVLLFALCAVAKQADEQLDDMRDEFFRANERDSQDHRTHRNRLRASFAVFSNN